MQRLGDTSRFKQLEQNIELVQADPIARHGFTQVPNFLFVNSGLSMGAIVVYSKFLSYAWHNNFCFPGQQRLADELGVSIGSVNAYTKELERAKLIEIVRRGQGMTNLYRIRFVVQKSRNAGVKS